MKPNPHRDLLLVGFAMAVGMCCAVSSDLVAQVELKTQLGFENRVTANHYAPIVVDVRGLVESPTCRLIVIQHVGNAWRGEATVEQDLGYDVQSDGVYESAIPVYDPVNPIVVECRSVEGAVLARTTLDLRSTYRISPYLVLDRRLPRFDETAALLDVSQLPERWWAFDTAKSLWVASPLTSEGWKAVTQWVVAGGSLVLVTGTDFYRMDSPSLRWLLPVSSPQLVSSDGGPSYLVGELDDSEVVLRTENGEPLLIEGRRGAGYVLLVTGSAQSLSAEQLRTIEGQVPSARQVSLEGAAEHTLGEQPTASLKLRDVALLVVLVGVLAIGIRAIGKNHPKAAWGLLGGAVVTLSVLSGFVSNRDKASADITTINIELSIQMTVGITMDWWSLYFQMLGGVVLSQDEGRVPMELLPRSLNTETSYSSVSSLTGTTLSVRPGEIRNWMSCGAAGSFLDVKTPSEARVRVSQPYSFDFDLAWVIVDGMAYPLSGLAQGVHEYLIEPQSAINLVALPLKAAARDGSSVSMILGELVSAFPLGKGDWLLAIADRSHLDHQQGVRKVREMTVALVSVEAGGDGAI